MSFRRKGRGYRRASMTFKNLNFGKTGVTVDSPMTPTNEPMTASNSLKSYIDKEYQKTSSEFLSMAKKDKNLNNIIKEDKKWLKQLKSGGMDQIFKARVCEEHYSKIFKRDQYHIKMFLKRFVKYMRGLIKYMIAQAFVKVSKTTKDFSEASDLIVDAMVKFYSTQQKGLERFHFPLRCMKESLTKHLFQHLGRDIIQLLKIHHCTEEEELVFSRAREVFQLDRLPFKDERLRLPRAAVPYDQPVKIMTSIVKSLNPEEMLYCLEKVFESIFISIDEFHRGMEVTSTDLSLIIAYCLLNCDVYKISAWLEYCRCFAPRGSNTLNIRLFCQILKWIHDDVRVTIESEKEGQEPPPPQIQKQPPAQQHNVYQHLLPVSGPEQHQLQVPHPQQQQQQRQQPSMKLPSPKILPSEIRQEIDEERRKKVEDEKKRSSGAGPLLPSQIHELDEKSEIEKYKNMKPMFTNEVKFGQVNEKDVRNQLKNDKLRQDHLVKINKFDKSKLRKVANSITSFFRRKKKGTPKRPPRKKKQKPQRPPRKKKGEEPTPPLGPSVNNGMVISSQSSMSKSQGPNQSTSSVDAPPNKKSEENELDAFAGWGDDDDDGGVPPPQVEAKAQAQAPIDQQKGGDKLYDFVLKTGETLNKEKKDSSPMIVRLDRPVRRLTNDQIQKATIEKKKQLEERPLVGSSSSSSSPQQQQTTTSTTTSTPPKTSTFAPKAKQQPIQHIVPEEEELEEEEVQNQEEEYLPMWDMPEEEEEEEELKKPSPPPTQQQKQKPPPEKKVIQSTPPPQESTTTNQPEKKISSEEAKSVASALDGLDLAKYGLDSNTVLTPLTPQLTSSPFDLAEYGVNVGGKNGEKSNSSILDGMDLSQYGVPSEPKKDGSSSSSSNETTTTTTSSSSSSNPVSNEQQEQQIKDKDSEIEKLRSELEKERSDKLGLKKELEKYRKALGTMKGRYTDVVKLSKKLRDELKRTRNSSNNTSTTSSSSSGDNNTSRLEEENTEIKTRLKKAMVVIVDLRKKNKFLMTKVKETGSQK